MADSDKKAKWQVTFTSKAAKQVGKLSDNIQDLLMLLISEIENRGYIRRNWKNFSSLQKGEYHCHLKKGHPTYVACWRVNKLKNKVEFYYVGSHEKAPY